MNRKRLRELILYLVFGGLTTLVNFAVYFPVLYAIGKDWKVDVFGLQHMRAYDVANVIAWVVAVTFAYVTNKLWVFDSRSWERRLVLREAGSFYAARLLSLGIELVGLRLMIEGLDIGKYGWDIAGRTLNGDDVAKLVMQFVVIVLNYVFSKLLIFTGKKGERG